VLQAIPVGAYIENDAPVRSTSESQVYAAIRRRQVPVERAPRRTFTFGNVYVDVMPPPPGVDTAQNDHSMLVQVRRARFRALLTGDSERPEISAILRHDSPARVDVLKAAHHGDPDALSAEWLRRLDPSVVVVSAGKGSFSPEARRRYSSPGRRLFTTEQSGDVTVFVDTDGHYRVAIDHPPR
jgi:competence protein ComEC